MSHDLTLELDVMAFTQSTKPSRSIIPPKPPHTEIPIKLPQAPTPPSTPTLLQRSPRDPGNQNKAL